VTIKIVERAKIIRTPKALVDRRIAEGLEDIDRGREHGPYSSVAEALAAFKKRARNHATARLPARLA
jgi:hypothetical protein